MIQAEQWQVGRVIGRSYRERTAPQLAWRFALLLVGGALALELITPFLIRYGLLPNAARYFSDLLLIAMIGLTVAQIFIQDRFPRVVLLLLAITVMGATVAAFEGQSPAATIWGWWSLFKYPIVGLFIYVQPRWPVQLSTWIVKSCWALVTCEVLLQLAQYATGEVPGDHLAGTFGRYGVGPLVMVLFFVSSLAVGHWLVWDDGKILAVVLLSSTISSVLGEMKVFPAIAAAIALLGLVFYVAKGGKLYKALIYSLLFSALLLLFGFYYNANVADVRGTRRIEAYFQSSTLQGYLNFVDHDEETGGYYLGRGFAMTYGWQLLQRDNTTLLFGYGLGARSESVALGIVGEGLRQGYYGLSAGSSLLVLMQELGLVGLAGFGGFLLWVNYTLWRYGSQTANPAIKVLCYGLIIYATLWPLWLWYHSVWTFGVSMLLYWAILGYLLHGCLIQPETKGSYENFDV